MLCKKPQQLIDGYIDGELGPTQRQAMKNHLESCPRCRQLEERLRKAKEAVFGQFGPDVKFPELNITLEEIYAGRQFPPVRRKRFGVLAGRVAAAIAVMSLFNMLLWEQAPIQVFPLAGDAIVTGPLGAKTFEMWETALIKEGFQVEEEYGKASALKLRGGEIVLLKENSRIYVVLSRRNRLTGSVRYGFRLKSGIITVDFGQRPGRRYFSAQTEQAQVGCRSGIFSVEAATGRKSVVQTAKGAVLVKVLDLRFYRGVQAEEKASMEIGPMGVRTAPLAFDMQQWLIKEVYRVAQLLQEMPKNRLKTK